MATSDYTSFLAALHARAFSGSEVILSRFPYFINGSREVYPDQYTLPKFSRSDRLDVFQWLLDHGANPHFNSAAALTPPIESMVIKEEGAGYLDVLVDHFGLDVLRCSTDVPSGDAAKHAKSGVLFEMISWHRLAPLAHVLKAYPSLMFDEGPKALGHFQERDIAPPYHWVALAQRLARSGLVPSERTQVVTMLSSFVAAHEARLVVAGLVLSRASATPS